MSENNNLIEIIAALTEKAVEETSKRVRVKLITLIKEHGTEVLVDTPLCEKWRKDHGRRNEENCPGYLGCLKLKLISDILIQLSSHVPQNPFQSLIWLNAVTDTVIIIIKVLQKKNVEELRRSLKELGIIEIQRRTGIEIG